MNTNGENSASEYVHGVKCSSQRWRL